MNLRVVKIHVFCVLIGLGANCFGAGKSIEQNESPSGSVVLSNLGDGDDVIDPSQPQENRAAQSDEQGSGLRSVSVGQSVEVNSSASTAADPAGSEPSGDVTQKATKYRDNMLNLPLLPNGRPANPAIQRRYLMVKKSDYIGGN